MVKPMSKQISLGGFNSARKWAPPQNFGGCACVCVCVCVCLDNPHIIKNTFLFPSAQRNSCLLRSIGVLMEGGQNDVGAEKSSSAFR